HAARFPEQVAEAAKVAAGIEGLPAADEVDNVLVLGMGVGALPGARLAAVGGSFVPLPLVVARGYGPPSFVGPGTLCFAVSYSGDTEETVEAAHAAASAGARMAARARGRRRAHGCGGPGRPARGAGPSLAGAPSPGPVLPHVAPGPRGPRGPDDPA